MASHRHRQTNSKLEVLQHHNGRGTPPHDHCADSCIVLSGLRRDHYRLARTTDSIRKGARLDLQSFSVGSKPHRDIGNGVESDRNINGGQRPSAKIIIINSKKTTQTRDTMHALPRPRSGRRRVTGLPAAFHQLPSGREPVRDWLGAVGISSGVYHGCSQMDHGGEALIGLVGAHCNAFELLEPAKEVLD